MVRVVLSVLLTLFSVLVSRAEKVRVACVGNSITYGLGVADRDVNSYPAQLQTYLGDGYDVQNFGISMRTLLKKGDYPYVETSQYRESLEFNPDIVIIKLGTNDSKESNMVYFDQFKSDYEELINSYKNLDSNPRIVLVTPVICFREEGESISNVRMKGKISPLIAELAYENGVEIFDGYSIFSDSHSQELMPDKLHPSAIGARELARNFGRMIKTDRDESFDIFSTLGEGKEFNYHGYRGKDFDNGEIKYRVVQPKKANDQHSWLLRARFWGHQPQLDRKLLELGFHIVYCDVADLFGSSEAVKRWDKVYDIVTKADLDKKLSIEAMSRGGLITYNWAVKNTKKIYAIYADAPVLDFKSWPMGEGDFAGGVDAIVAKLEAAYGMDREELLKFKKNPIDHAAKIAKSDIKLIHVVGDADIIVPVYENSLPFIQKLSDAGKEVELISKPGIGHHPHSLSAPEPILQFILDANGIDPQ